MGLMPQPMQKPGGSAAPMASTEGAPPGPSDEQTMNRDEESNVSPEEQAQYDQFVGKAAEIIYTDKHEVEPAILEALKVPKGAPQDGGSPPIMALANAAAQIIKKLDTSAQEQGTAVSDDVLAHGGEEIVEELGEVARTAGIHDYSEEELTGAFYQTVDLLRDHLIETGRTNPETLKNQFSEVEAADKEGKLGDLLPGMGDATMGEPAVAPK